MISPVLCLAAAIFFEARGETIQGQIAVADVVLNRVASSRFPDTICEVVNQPKQFSFTHDGLSDNIYKYERDLLSATIAVNIAKSVIIHPVNRLGITSTHYHADYVSPDWSTSPAMVYDLTIGKHIFYTEGY